MNKRFRKLILPVSILATSQVYALGLGNIQVSSALDETLNGEIPIIIDSNEDIENIVVSLASDKDYKRVGLDKSYVPTNIVVNIVEKDGIKLIEISSNGPISEPIVSLLISVDWSNGHLLREYTILLDPPLFNPIQTQQNYSEPVQTQTYETPTKIESTIKKNSDVDPMATIASTPTYSRNNQVVVESGDTLWKIAGTISDGYGSRQQTMVAIFNKNPAAFHNADMNQLQKGAILDMPDANDVSMISSSDAMAEVRSHVQNWSNLQTQDDGSDIYDSGSSVDYGIELVPPNDSDSSSSSNSSGYSNGAENNKLRLELGQVQEELVSSNLEKGELTSRVGDLEQIVKDQESAMSIKDTNLAQLQEQLADSDTNEDGTTVDDVWDNTEDDSTNDIGLTDDSLDDLNTNVADTETNEDSLLVVDNNSENDVSDSDTLSSTDMDSRESEIAKEPVIKNVPVSPKKQSIMDKILAYKYEGLIALGVILLSGLMFMFVKRRGQEEEETEVGGFLDSISSKNASLLDEENLDSESDFDSELDSEDSKDSKNAITEVNLSNLDVEDALDDEEPEVVVMDDQSDDSDDNLEQSFDLDLDDNDFDETHLNEKDVDSELEELDFSELDDDSDSEELEVEDLSLDFDLDDLELDETEETEGDSSDEDNVEDEVEDLTLDFDMSEDELESDDDLITEPVTIDLDSEQPEDKEESKEEEIEDLEFDLSDLYDADDIDLDEIGDSDSSNEESTTDNQTSDEDDYNLDLDFDTITLDLDADEDTGSDSTAVQIDEPEEVDIGLDFDDIVDDDAIDTKLDLAKAYFEMGDADGAKQMVEEIIEEGTEAQKSKAEKLKTDIEKL